MRSGTARPLHFAAVPLNDLIGFVAAILTTSAFVPQAWMTWKTRSAHGVSLGMYVVFVLGVALWLWYGINLGSQPIIDANAVTLSIATGAFSLGASVMPWLCSYTSP